MSASLSDVYLQHRQGLFSLALAITGSRQQAEDAVQEAFAGMVRQPRVQRDRVAYIFKAVRNAAIDIQRHRKRDQKLAESLFNGYACAVTPTAPAHDCLTKERDDILRKAIAELPAEQREAILLKAFAGLTFEQAGEVANVPPKTIATRYRRALQQLESRLQGRL